MKLKNQQIEKYNRSVYVKTYNKIRVYIYI